MKVKPSVKPMCEFCRVIRRKGVVRIICSRNRAISRDRVQGGKAGYGPNRRSRHTQRQAWKLR